MDKKEDTCHICGNTTKNTVEPIPFCAVCGADLLGTKDEIVQMKKDNFMYKRWEGLLVLTNRRLILIKNPVVAQAAGIFGEIAADKQATAMTKRGERVVFSLTPDEIISVEIGKYGLLGKALLIHSVDGNQYQLLLGKKLMDEWLDAIALFKTKNA